MKRHSALHPLSHDHHQGLILALQLKKGAPPYKGMPATLEGKKDYTISFYNTELIKHFRNEEKILFPASTGKSDEIDMLISEIISEHRKMEMLVDELNKSDKLEEVMDELGWLLEKHIRKEERQLFVEIEKVLSDEELSIIAKRLSE